MDVIGTLTAFSPGDLAILEYATFQTTNKYESHTIPASKFIIIFPPYVVGSESNDCLLVARGTDAGFSYLNTNTVSVNVGFSADGRTVQLYTSATSRITIGYRPI